MLVVTPTEKLDVLDYIVNENYIEECKINDWKEIKQWA
jgi:hypothetical protein